MSVERADAGCVSPDGHEWVMDGVHLSVDGQSVMWLRCRWCAAVTVDSPGEG